MSTQDYSVEPKLWGPSIWSTLHTTALFADSSKKYSDFQVLVSGLSELLPCKSCRDDFSHYVKLNPVTVPAFEWTVRLHNSVNKKLRKTEFSIENAKAAWSYESCTQECTKSKEPETTLGGYIAIIVTLGFLAWILLFTMKLQSLSSLKT